MHIDLDEAIKIYARACQSWYRGKAHNVALKRARELRVRGDQDGFAVWQQLASEIKQQVTGLNPRAKAFSARNLTRT